jgi:hypothetical protein
MSRITLSFGLTSKRIYISTVGSSSTSTSRRWALAVPAPAAAAAEAGASVSYPPGLPKLSSPKELLLLAYYSELFLIAVSGVAFFSSKFC